MCECSELRIPGHRRTVSYGSPADMAAICHGHLGRENDTPALEASTLSWVGAASSQSLYNLKDLGRSYDHPSMSDLSSTGPDANTQDLIENAYLMLDPQLHPISPSINCEESMRIFEEHKRMAQEYLKVQTELALLTKYKHELAEQLSEAEGLSQLEEQDSQRYKSELRQLQSEKESLVHLHRNLKRQLEIIKSAQQKRQRGGQGSPPSGQGGGGGNGGGAGPGGERSGGGGGDGDGGWVMVQRS